MMTQKKMDDTAIPEFLKVANRGKKFKLPKAKSNGYVKPVEPTLDIDPDVMEVINAETKAGRFRKHWLEDRSTVRLFEQQMHRERAAKEAREAARLVAKEAARAERELLKSLQPEFGTGIRIIVLNRNPKRQAGAARIPRFASLLAYLDKHPNASVAEIFKHTSYIKGDFIRDQRLKIIKTDLITQTKPKKGQVK